MVAQHRHRLLPQFPDQPQHLHRPGAPVDQIPGQPEEIVGRIEADQFQQPLQGIITALDVADGIDGHLGLLFQLHLTEPAPGQGRTIVHHP